MYKDTLVFAKAGYSEQKGPDNIAISKGKEVKQGTSHPWSSAFRDAFAAIFTKKIYM